MRRFLLSALSLAVASHAWAATAPVTYAVRNSGGEVVMYAPTTTYTKTISGADHTFVNSSTEITATGVTVDKLQRLGYRPDDPRVGQTINAIQQEAVNTATGAFGSGVGTAAATLLAGAAAGTPVGWGAMGIAFLVGVAGFGVTQLVTGGLNWLINSSGMTQDGGAVVTDPGLQPGYCYTYAGTDLCEGTKEAVASKLCSVNQCTFGSTTLSYSYHDNYIWATESPSGSTYKIGQPTQKLGTPAPSTQPAQSPAATMASLPDSEKTKPVTAPILADAISGLWKSAYDRSPSTVLPPQTVTPSDVTNFLAQNPSLQPMGDNMTSAPAPFSPTAAPSSPTATSPGASTNPGTGGIVGPGTQTPTTTPTTTNPKPDLGPDPGIGSPTLEATPTAAAILAPLLGLFPDLRSYVVPSHSAECPKPSIDLWDKHLVLQEHCTVLEGVRPALYAIMAAVWLMVAVFIILAA